MRRPPVEPHEPAGSARSALGRKATGGLSSSLKIASSRSLSGDRKIARADLTSSVGATAWNELGPIAARVPSGASVELSDDIGISSGRISSGRLVAAMLWLIWLLSRRGCPASLVLAAVEPAAARPAAPTSGVARTLGLRLSRRSLDRSSSTASEQPDRNHRTGPGLFAAHRSRSGESVWVGAAAFRG